MTKEEVEGKEAEQVITMEEDGRLGNLLMEMATLLLIGRHANVTVSLLPQVAHIVITILSILSKVLHGIQNSQYLTQF